jgi:hypothetical protein
VKGYEKSDIRFPVIAKTYGGLAVMLALVAAGAGMAIRVFSHSLPADPRRHKSPPEPRLQADPAGDLKRFRTKEDAALNSYEWEDRSRGAIRMPIDRAMRLLLRRGLPTRAAAP